MARSGWSLASVRDIAALAPSEIPREIGAGISVAAVAVPIGLAYAKLTGVPPEMGLYASIALTVAYALLGASSRFLIVGPDTSICLLLATTITHLGVTAIDERAATASGLTILVGVGCLLAGILRLGSLSNLISRPVLVGYLAGVSVTLFIAQLPSLTAVDLESPGIFRPVLELVRRSSEISGITLSLGIGAFALLRIIKIVIPRVPGPAVVLILGISLSYTLGLPARGVAVVGTIPSGLPVPALPQLKGEPAQLLLSVVGLLIVSFSSGILTARSFADRANQSVNPNRELFGFGAADIAAGLFQGFAGTGADSRTAVALSSGGRTALVAIVAGVTVAIVLTLLTAPLAMLPQATLGAILASAAINLFDINGFKALARIDRSEFAFALVAAAGVIWIGVLEGVFIAVVVTLLNLVRLAAHPVEGAMGRHPDTGHLVTLQRHPDAIMPEGGVVYIFQASVLFLNAEYFRERALLAVSDASAPAWIVIDASAMMHADSSAVDAFRKLLRELDGRGIAVYIGGGHGHFVDVMARSGISDLIGTHRMYATVEAALEAAEAAFPDTTR